MRNNLHSLKGFGRRRPYLVNKLGGLDLAWGLS